MTTKPIPGSFAARVLSDPSASNVLKATLAVFLDRDPVDARNDAQILLAAMADHLTRIEEVSR